MRPVRLLAVAAVLVVSTVVAVPLVMTGVTTASATTTLDPGVKGCDVLLTAPIGHDCLLPWPNNAFTVASKKTPTGRQLAVSSTLDPTNVKGVHVSTTYINQGDGFSPGSVIMTYVPNLDLVASHIASSTDIGSSLDSNAPIVLLDTATRQARPILRRARRANDEYGGAVAADPPRGSAHRGPPLRGRPS